MKKIIWYMNKFSELIERLFHYLKVLLICLCFFHSLIWELQDILKLTRCDNVNEVTLKDIFGRYMNWQNTILGRIYHWKKIRSVFNLICTKSKKKYFLRRCEGQWSPELSGRWVLNEALHGTHGRKQGTWLPNQSGARTAVLLIVLLAIYFTTWVPN